MIQPNTRFAARYHLLRRIGTGGYSEVWLAEDILAGNMPVALKIFAPDKGLDEQGIALFSKEYALVFNLNHPNLLRPMHFDVSNGSPYLVMQYCEKGSLFGRTGEMSETELARFLLQAASALHYLHNQDPPVIHQDIKPDNFLIDYDGNYLLSDFGISSKIRKTLTNSMGNVQSSAGTTSYMAPERFSRLLEDRSPIKANDIFSLGVTAFELLTGELPYGDLGGVAAHAGSEPAYLPASFSPELGQLLSACLSKTTWERPTAESIVLSAQNYLKNGKWLKPETVRNKPPEETLSMWPEDKNTKKTSGTSSLSHSDQIRPEKDEGTTHYSPGSAQEKVPTDDIRNTKPKTGRKKFLWIALLFLGLIVLVLATQIGQKSSVEDIAEKNRRDSLIMDSLRRVDSIDAAYKAMAIQDSIRLADSLVKANQKSQNQAITQEASPVTETKPKKPENFGIEMILVKGGTFRMGCNPDQDDDCDSDENPVHQVTIGDFYIGKYEVTQKQWTAVMNNNPSSFKGCDDCPVENISWNDIQAFIRNLNQKTGRKYRLPTEAEWEYAARGGTRSRGYKYAGSNNIDEVAWYDGNSSGETHRVGRKKANELGLYDMSGNVWEWCSDWKGNYSSSSQTNPRGASTGPDRVIRGGSWSINPQNCRVTNRNNFYPADPSFYNGLRLAETP